MKKFVVSLGVIMAICVCLIAWDYYRFDAAWSISYLGMSEGQAEHLLGPRDTGDFDGDYWCNGIKLNGYTVSTKALFLAVDGSQRIVDQKILTFPDSSICLRTYIHEK